MDIMEMPALKGGYAYHAASGMRAILLQAHHTSMVVQLMGDFFQSSVCNERYRNSTRRPSTQWQNRKMPHPLNIPMRRGGRERRTEVMVVTMIVGAKAIWRGETYAGGEKP
jgi:hypothetical protein